VTHRTSWDYIYDICDTFPPSAKNTFIENFLDMAEYVSKLNELLALVPTELEDLELGQAWTDMASFQYAINNFYESESEHYTADLDSQVTDLVLKTRLQREAIESEIDRRGLRYAFSGLSEWEPAL
jgi:lipid II:glycine glycyltransferase (peptidoglycan interpeptide bridge formation enzyme)